MKKFMTLVVLSLILTSCYRMPGEDDCSVIPTTNNLSVTGQGNRDSWTPNMQY